MRGENILEEKGAEEEAEEDVDMETSTETNKEIDLMMRGNRKETTKKKLQRKKRKLSKNLRCSTLKLKSLKTQIGMHSHSDIKPY